MADEELIISYSNGLQILTFNKPKRLNFFDSSMIHKVIDALNDGSARPDVKMTVVTGKGPYFTSGANFNLSSDTTGSLEGITRSNVAVFSKFINALIDYPKLLVALVNGHAVGMGVTMLALFDLVYAVESATFHTPFVSLGLSAEGCSSYLFPRIMGRSLAAKMLYFGYKMSALEAQNCGFVTGIYKPESTEAVLNELQQYAKMPKDSLIATKRVMRYVDQQALKAINLLESEVLNERFMSEDFFNAMAEKLTKKNRSKL